MLVVAVDGSRSSPRLAWTGEDATLDPQSLLPAYALAFEVVQREAGYKNSFGWYNVTGQAPELEDLHEILGCNDGVGTEKVISIKADPD